MHVKNLKLINYRNYSNENMEFAKCLNIICGDNAQGKTNLVESLFLCSSGRSHRTSKDSELIKNGEKGYYIKICVEKSDRELLIEMKYDNYKKKIRINGKPAKNMGDLMGHLKVVIFSPEDLMVLKKGPSERRRFTDIAISQLKPLYFYNLKQYFKILNQRNNLLKSIKGNGKLEETLDIWNENLIKAGSKVMLERNKFIERLDFFTRKNNSILTDNKEIIKIEYSPSIKCSNYQSMENIKEIFKKTIKRLKNQEIKMGTTLCGPQRDDMKIIMNGNSIRIFGSQGQQRTAILSMKLAKLNIIEEQTGEKPILLLDDVMSELDNKRQDFLYNSIGNVQTFITTTKNEIRKIEKWDEKRLFKVENGRIIRNSMI